eukprot:UN17383
MDMFYDIRLQEYMCFCCMGNTKQDETDPEIELQKATSEDDTNTNIGNLDENRTTEDSKLSWKELYQKYKLFLCCHCMIFTIFILTVGVVLIVLKTCSY